MHKIIVVGLLCLLLLPINDYYTLGYISAFTSVSLAFAAFLFGAMKRWLSFILLFCWVVLFFATLVNFSDPSRSLMLGSLKAIIFLHLFAAASTLSTKELGFLIRFVVVFNIILIIPDLLNGGTYDNIYRSGNYEWHSGRANGLFLYPGDLGAFGAILLSWLLVKRQSSKFERFDVILVFCSIVFLFLSQSRIAFGQLTLSVVFYSLVFCKTRANVIIVFFLLFSIILGISMSPYVLQRDYIVLYESLMVMELGVDKRLDEIILLYKHITTGDGEIFQQEYLEGSVSSNFVRLGLPALLFFNFALPAIFFLNCYYRRILKDALVIWLPLVLSMLVSAPLDRPKLQVVLAALAVLFLVSQRQKPSAPATKAIAVG